MTNMAKAYDTQHRPTCSAHTIPVRFAVPPFEEIGGGEEDGRGGDVGAGAQEWVFGVGLGVLGLDDGQRSEMGSGGCAGDAQAIGVDAVFVGVGLDVSDARVDVGEHL